MTGAFPARAVRWMILGDWRAHPGRPLLGVLAIAIGVALGFAVHLVNASALGSFERGIAAVSGEADVRIEALGPDGFDEALYPRIARLPAVDDLSPVVRLPAQSGKVQLDLLGIDIIRAATVTPALIGRTVGAEAEGARPAPGASAFDPDGVYLSSAALDRTGKSVGDMITIEAGGRAPGFRIVGTIPGIGDARAVAMLDIAAAQWRFGRLGRLDRVDLKLAPGVDPGRGRTSLASALPAGTALVSAADEERRSDGLSRAYRVNLQVLALVALLTGAFLVYSAQSLSVARRVPQFALLRVLGARPGVIVGQVVVEGLLLGTLGSLLGLALGFGLASLALDTLGSDLGAGYFDSAQTPPLVFAPIVAGVFAALGIAAAVFGSTAPGVAAARLPPASALKNLGDPVDPRRRAPVLPALLLAAAGILAAALPPVGNLPLFGYLSIALLLAAGIAMMPPIARLILAPLARRGAASPTIDLAAKRLWGAPSQASVALCGIVASTSLMIAMAVMVASFRTSVDEWLGQVLPADLYMTVTGGDRGPLSPADQARLAALPGVEQIRFSLTRPVQLAPDRPAVALIARDDPDAAFPPIGDSIVVRPPAIPVWVSEPAARLYGLERGEGLMLPVGARGVTEVRVAGIWRDYARQHGAIAMAARDYERLTGDRNRGEASIRLAPGSAAGPVADAVLAGLPVRLRARTAIVPAAELRAQALAIFDRSFAITYALEAIAIVVGLAGVAATISAQTAARTREFGMLQHLGVTRGQIVRMLATEGALLGVVGGIAGLALGCVIAQVLIRVVNPQSFNWTMETSLPLGLFAGVALALIGASAGTAVLAGRRALSVDAILATREDW